MSETERLRITIDGEPIVEADARASHLSIMHGLLGLPLPEGDPYEFTDVQRSVAKAWITATLGKGSPVKRWAPRAAKDNPELLHFDPKRVGDVICERYALSTPVEFSPEVAGENSPLRSAFSLRTEKEDDFVCGGTAAVA
jgi:hypothetical protein